MILAEMTMQAFIDAREAGCSTVYLPVGALEEHGSHLPLGTDTMQAYDVGLAAARQVPLFVAPAIPYGNCRSTIEHPGTISISTDTLKGLVKDLVREFYRQGLTRCIIVTGHAGAAHVYALQDAGEELLRELPLLRIAVVTEYMLAKEEGRTIIETPRDAHAGEIETSRIMYRHPELVCGTSPEEYPTFPVGVLVRDKRRYWPGGVWGDPSKASAQKGQAIEELVVAKVVDLVNVLNGPAYE